MTLEEVRIFFRNQLATRKIPPGITSVEQLMRQFQQWICGQTCRLREDGKVDYYDHDVKRFLEWKLQGRRTYFD